MASANPDLVEAIPMTDMAARNVDESDSAPKDYDTEKAMIAKEVDTEGGQAGPESKSKAEAIIDISEEEDETHEKGKTSDTKILNFNTMKPRSF